MTRPLSLLFIIWLCSIIPVYSQLERRLENTSQEVDLTFHAPRQINLFTVEPLDKGTLHFAIMHTFGTVDGGVRDLFGIDNGANIQFSLEYGFNDTFSVGMARQSRDKVYNLYGRYHLLTQTQDNRMPLSLSIMGGGAMNSSDYSFLLTGEPTLSERTSYAMQWMIARKFSNKISLQLSPMAAYFIDPNPVFFIEGDQHLYTALGISGKYKLTGKTSLTAQWIANLNNDLRNNLGLGVDLEAGGHVFQLYLVTSPFLNETYLLAGGNGTPGEQFRLGFNVNRVFGYSR